MLRAALATHCPSGRRLGAKLALAAGVAAAGLLGFLAWRWAGAPAPGSAGAAASELKRLRGALASAQAKLTTLRAVKSGKAERAARAQQKVVARLQAKKEGLERALARAEAAAGGGGAAGGQRRTAAAAAATDEVRGYSDEEEEEQVDAGAMYSDEE